MLNLLFFNSFSLFYFQLFLKKYTAVRAILFTKYSFKDLVYIF